MVAFKSNFRKCLTMALALISALPALSANAQEWEHWGGDDTMTSYLLKDSHKLNGSVATAWFMLDHKTPQKLDNGIQYRSAKVEQVFLCNDNSTTVSSYIAFSDAMGKGKQVYSSNVQSTRYTKYSPDDWKKMGFDRFCKKSWLFWR